MRGWTSTGPSERAHHPRADREGRRKETLMNVARGAGPQGQGPLRAHAAINMGPSRAPSHGASCPCDRDTRPPNTSQLGAEQKALAGAQGPSSTACHRRTRPHGSVSARRIRPQPSPPCARATEVCVVPGRQLSGLWRPHLRGRVTGPAGSAGLWDCTSDRPLEPRGHPVNWRGPRLCLRPGELPGE